MLNGKNGHDMTCVEWDVEYDALCKGFDVKPDNAVPVAVATKECPVCGGSLTEVCDFGRLIHNMVDLWDKNGTVMHVCRECGVAVFR